MSTRDEILLVFMATKVGGIMASNGKRRRRMRNFMVMMGNDVLSVKTGNKVRK
jgi:hypothetical protein